MRKSATKEPKLVKKGQNFALSMLKSTPARKKYTTAGCGGCDKYELWACILFASIYTGLKSTLLPVLAVVTIIELCIPDGDKSKN